MIGMFGPRHFDVLAGLRDCLCVYKESRLNIVEFLSECAPANVLTPAYALKMIVESYVGGALHLPGSIPSPVAGTPSKYYVRAKEAERCIRVALHDVYGVKRKRGDAKNDCWPHASSGVAPLTSMETEGERVVKEELRRILAAPHIRKELIALKDAIKFIASNNGSYPWLNVYANLKEFDRRTRPVIMALEREALPAECAVARVDRFLHELYRNVERTISLKCSGEA